MPQASSPQEALHLSDNAGMHVIPQQLQDMAAALRPKVGDWVWRVRLLSEGKVQRGASLFCTSMQEVADYIGAEEPDNTENSGYALERYQLKESDLPNGELGEFDGF